ncbi:TetR/AcrR family transcriptional regulator [Falsarthrobacter nasiphocae]|uniref:AcrR family transcriptional regulator n=1 Tax=Falsarthrobacter nasiphocae TaxID=189863 RepID=A0AAE4C5I1_9MICC|nr:TetR/AcrR family transcriptional regulator [Falsarthrobacter nasiphocae]MDR6891533.1 AcrR family transcriptional regulator [Falsarthrobacter nasiphocae]
MRAVARLAGVSTAAPYRHFKDREALDDAVAIEGFQTLYAEMKATTEATTDDTDPVTAIGDLAMTYVNFAISHPAVFRIMFSLERDRTDEARHQAINAAQGNLHAFIQRLFPAYPADGLTEALVAFGHGFAFLHLDGRYAADVPAQVEHRVRSALAALLEVPPRGTTGS